MPERTKPSWPLPRSLFTRASATVGTDCSSLYTQLTVRTIKLEALRVWQKVNFVLGVLQPRQIPEVMVASTTLRVRVVAPWILIPNPPFCREGTLWTSSAGLSISWGLGYTEEASLQMVYSEENRISSRNWRSSTPMQRSYVFGINLPQPAVSSVLGKCSKR